MTAEELKRNIKAKKHPGWYIFCGEEEYLKRYYLRQIAITLCPDQTLDGFNHIRFDGADISVSQIEESVNTPPMMADFKFIEWTNADIDHMNEKKLSELENLFLMRDSYPECTLVISASDAGFDPGREKKRSRLYTRLSACADIIVFEKSTDAQLLSWMKKHFDKENIAVDAPMLRYMLDRCGHMMDVLEKEISKLIAFAKYNGDGGITQQTVRKVCTLSVETDSFELSNAIFDRDIKRALSAIYEMEDRRVEPIFILSSLSRIYSSLLAVSSMMREGRVQSEISSTLGIKAPYPLAFYIKASSRRNPAMLAAATERCRVLDVSFKSGAPVSYSAIERFISEYI